MIKTNGIQEDLVFFSSLLSKRLKQKFGKGPETCFASSKDDLLSIHIKKFKTAAEEVLVEKDDLKLAIQFRSSILNAILDDFMEEVKENYQLEIESAFHDWNYTSDSGIILFKIREHKSKEIDFHIENNKIIKTLQSVTSNIHKVPTHCRLVRLNVNLYLIECSEIMLDIEKVLYKNGYEDILIDRSNAIKKSYAQNIHLFESAFERMVESLFIMWDYENDKGLIVFNLQQ
jgi:uncharacterized protein YbcI